MLLLTVNEIREFNRISDEENWGIVTYHIVVSFFSIELYSKSSGISHWVRWSFFSSNSGESEEEWSPLSNTLQEGSLTEPKSCVSEIDYFDTSWVTSRYPWAPAPFACTTLSGILSLSNLANLSIKWTSCRRIGPLGPAVCEFWLSSTGAP